MMKLHSEIPTVIVYAMMTRGYCCFQCGHCTDEVIAEMMDCKCKCHG